MDWKDESAKLKSKNFKGLRDVSVYSFSSETRQYRNYFSWPIHIRSFSEVSHLCLNNLHLLSLRDIKIMTTTQKSNGKIKEAKEKNESKKREKKSKKGS